MNIRRLGIEYANFSPRLILPKRMLKPIKHCAV